MKLGSTEPGDQNCYSSPRQFRRRAGKGRGLQHSTAYVATPLQPITDADGVEHRLLHPYGVGVDVHSKFIQICVLVQTSRKVLRYEREASTTWESLVAAKKWVLDRLGDVATPDTLRYCLESTGTYHLPILLCWRGIPSVVNPVLAGPSRRKTDVLDAQLLASHSITGLWKASFIPSENAQILRVLWSQRHEAKRAATRHANRINNIILRFGHTFAALNPIRSARGEGILDCLINGQPLPREAAVNPAGLPPAIRWVVRDLREQMLSAQKAEHDAIKRAHEFLRCHKFPTGNAEMRGDELLKLLCTVPGIGETTALTWLAEVCDPRRFQTEKQVAAFAGCDPSVKVSAGKVTSYSRRVGNARLHYYLVHAAGLLLSLGSHDLAQWGRAIQGRHKKGGYRKACSALARRLAVMLWHVHRLGVPFDASKYNFTDRVPMPDLPLAELGFTKKQLRALTDSGVRTTATLWDCYYTGKLGKLDGVGAGTIARARQIIIGYAAVKDKETQDNGNENSRKTAIQYRNPPTRAKLRLVPARTGDCSA